MTRISIILNNKWVLQHKNDEQLPIDFLGNIIGKMENVEKVRSSISTLVLSASTDESGAQSIVDGLLESFGEQYGIDGGELEGVVTVIYEKEESEEKTDAEGDKEKESVPSDDGDKKGETEETADAAPKAQDGEPQPFAKFFKKTGSAEAEPPSEERIEACMKKIEGLTGGAEFKSLARELRGVAPYIKENNTFDTFLSQTYLFSINSGNGVSTYLQSLAELIVSLGICPAFKSPTVLEYRIPAANGRTNSFEDVLDTTFDMGDTKNVRLLSIDLSEWIDSTNHPDFKSFLTELPRQIGKYIIVFRVPFVDKDILGRIQSALNDVVFVKGISFPPLTKAEIQSFAKSEIEGYGFRISNAAWEGFHERITEERSDGRFYGINTVKKVVRELIYEKQLSSARRGKNDLLISKKDTMELCKDAEGIGLSGYEMLDRLVSADALKAKINEIVSQILLARSSESVDTPCIHMRFVGNPGTGKTTVARIIGKILKEKGVLRVGGFFEYGGRDFCGRYVGETAPKTVSMCRDAYGSVLFIDEAYSLYRGGSFSVDYGREALDVLIAEMENHRSDLVVIMAGYPDEMKTLMEGNAGLASRMPYVIEFPNFDRNQLYEIYASMVKRQFKSEDALFTAAREFFDGIPDHILNSKDFSNARFVRNLFERTWAKASMRCQLDGSTGITIKRVDFEAAIADKEFNFNQKKKTVKIGF